MLVSARNGNESEAAQQPVAMPTPAPNHAVPAEDPQTNQTVSSRPALLHFRRAIKRDAKVRLAITGPSHIGRASQLCFLRAAFALRTFALAAAAFLATALRCSAVIFASLALPLNFPPFFPWFRKNSRTSSGNVSFIPISLTPQ